MWILTLETFCTDKLHYALAQCICQADQRILFERFIAQKLCTACSRTSYKIVPLTNLNTYLHNDTSETEMNMNVSVTDSSE
jgi:hypothetical protein